MFVGDKPRVGCFMNARRPDYSRLVPGVQKRRKKFEARIPNGNGGKIYLGLFATEAEAIAAVVARRKKLGLRPARFAISV